MIRPTLNVALAMALLASALSGPSVAPTLASDGAGTTSPCIDLTRSDWEKLTAARLGEIGCLVGPLSAGADGVFFKTNPPWGFPPYGALISVQISRYDPRVYKTSNGKIVALKGRILGRAFCTAQPSFAGCDETDATFFKYYLHGASFTD